MRTQQEFVATFIEGAPKSASPGSRAAFANAVFSHLAITYPKAWRARHAAALREPFVRNVIAIENALVLLGGEVQRDPVGAHALGLTDQKLKLLWRAVDAYLDPIIERFMDGPHETRGRNNRAEIVIATMIAEEYRIHFGRFPGRSNTDVRNPFAAFCRAVSEYLTEMERPIQIGPAARNSGIAAAKANWGE